MTSVTIQGLSDESLAVSLLRAAADPAERDRLHELLGGFCHQCRNTLNSMKLSLYLAKRGSDTKRRAVWSDLEPRYMAVEQFIERLQLIVRPMALTPVRLALSLLFEERGGAWSATMAASGRTLTCVSPPDPVVVSFDPFHLGHALDGLVAWRAAAGPPGTEASLHWWVDRGRSYLEWSETVTNTERPAATRDEALVLPLLGRVATAHGGSFSIDARDGLLIRLNWPVDAFTHPG
jgi:hypothetical protein